MGNALLERARAVADLPDIGSPEERVIAVLLAASSREAVFDAIVEAASVCSSSGNRVRETVDECFRALRGLGSPEKIEAIHAAMAHSEEEGLYRDFREASQYG